MSDASTAVLVQPSFSLKISETILKTSRLDEMKAWYTTVLGVTPFFDFTPPEGTTPLTLGGQMRASDLRMCFFRLWTDYPSTQMMSLFEEARHHTLPDQGRLRASHAIDDIRDGRTLREMRS